MDSSSSLQCIKALKALAKGGRTVVCTIHQPSATMYEMFDHVYVLSDGYCLYQGSSLNTIPYLLSVGLPCPQYHNPADFSTWLILKFLCNIIEFFTSLLLSFKIIFEKNFKKKSAFQFQKWSAANTETSHNN